MTLAEINSLRRLPWSQLERRALDAGVRIGQIKQARTRDELRLLVIGAES